jgi:ATP synthase protein I
MSQPEMTPRPPARSRTMSSLALCSATGALLAVAVVIGYHVGLLLDRWLGTTPWLLLLFVALGLAAGLYEVAHLVKAAARPGSRERPAE